MGRFTWVVLVFVAVAAIGLHSVHGHGDVGSEGLELALSILPRVDRVELDPSGRLIGVEGLLTPPGEALPIEVARSFMAVHRELFGAAGHSEFAVESVQDQGERSAVTLRQVVDGFAAQRERLRLVFAGSELESVRGVVLRQEDVGPMGSEPLPKHRAVAIAGRDLPAGLEGVSTSAHKVLIGEDHRRCWRVEIIYVADDAEMLLTVVIDAKDGIVLQKETLLLENSYLAGSHPEGEGAPDRIIGCEPVVPPVGGFSSSEGQAQWHGADTGCGRWEFDRARSASFFHGNCMEYLCDPYPSTSDCDHGEIRREGLDFGLGYEGVQIEFLTPDQDVFMRLRWGPGANRAAPFVVAAGSSARTMIEIDLSLYDSWKSEAAGALTLELVDDHFVWIRSLDLLPGPWLEFSRGPELATLTPGDELTEGDHAAVFQDVRNTGCRLEGGTHPKMRATEYALYRLTGFGWEFDSVVCDDVRIPGDIPPGGSLENLPMCGLELPEPGTWRLEGRFRSHPSPSAFIQFDVRPALHPDLAIDSSVPVDLYSGNLGSWPCRTDLLDLSRYDDPDPDCALPYVIALRVSDAGLDTPTTSSVSAWGRTVPPSEDPGVCDPDSGGWVELGDPRSWIFGTGGEGIVDLPLDRDQLEDLSLGSAGWSLLDLKIVVDPIDGESDLSDNTLCLASWILVAESGLGDSIGTTWVGDDYFLDPDHWPPNGLTWTGLTVAHEEGAANHDPDSALVVLAVEDGANEEPRLVWFEDRPGDNVSGLLLRYRRDHEGFGGAPFLEAGAEEANGVPLFDLDVAGHWNRSGMVADSQWRTLVWRRGSAAPFGSFPVPVLETPGRTGDTLSLHLAPDSNCLLDETGCPSGLHPETMVDIVGGWYEQGSAPPQPVFFVAGLRMWGAGGWQVIPPEVIRGESVDLGVEIQNIGNAAGTAHLYARVDITPLSEHNLSQVVTGSAVVTIPPNASYHLRLEPAWMPGAVGNFLLDGVVSESGQQIGHVWTDVQVVEGGSGCAVPAIDLP